MANQGTIIFKPQFARLTKDTETFGKMDPYVKVNLGGVERISSVAQDQGKTPAWTDSFSFQGRGEATIEVSIWEKDDLSRDDFLGKVSIPLQDVYTRRNVVDSKELRDNSGKSTGTLNYQIEFTAGAGGAGGWGAPQQPGFNAQAGGQAGWGAPQAGWGQPQGGFGAQGGAQAGWGQPAPQQGGWGQPGPQQGWGQPGPQQGWGQPGPQGGFGAQGGAQGGWGQGAPGGPQGGWGAQGQGQGGWGR